MKQRRDNIKLFHLKKFTIDSLIIFGVTIGLILLVEVFLRVFFPQTLRGIKITGETFSNRDDVLGMRYTPGARWQFMHPEYKVEYAINEHGFRDKKEHSIPKPEGTIRVLLVGDSFTFGQGVDYEQTWPVIAEKWFEEHDMRQIELVKAGIQGMDTRSEFLLIKELLEKYECDVIVIGFLINDLYSNSLYGIEEVKELSASKIVELSSSNNNKARNDWSKTVRNLFIRSGRGSDFHLLNLVKRMAIFSDDLYCKLYKSSKRAEFFTLPLSPAPQKKLQITEVIFNYIAEYCQSRGKMLIVVSIPQQFQVLYFEQGRNDPDADVGYFERYFCNYATANSFKWISTCSAFNNYPDAKSELFYRWDGHLTYEGHMLVAREFFEGIIPFLKKHEISNNCMELY